MQLEEVKAAVAELWNTHGLNWPPAFQKHMQKTDDLDLFDWLRVMFGFQECPEPEISALYKDVYVKGLGTEVYNFTSTISITLKVLNGLKLNGIAVQIDKCFFSYSDGPM